MLKVKHYFPLRFFFFWKFLFTAQTFLPSCGENTELSININIMMLFKTCSWLFPWYMWYTIMVGSPDIHRTLPAVKCCTKMKQNLNNKIKLNQVLDCKKSSNLEQGKTAMIKRFFLISFDQFLVIRRCISKYFKQIGRDRENGIFKVTVRKL